MKNQLSSQVKLHVGPVLLLCTNMVVALHWLGTGLVAMAQRLCVGGNEFRELHTMAGGPVSR